MSGYGVETRRFETTRRRNANMPLMARKLLVDNISFGFATIRHARTARPRATATNSIQRFLNPWTTSKMHIHHWVLFLMAIHVKSASCRPRCTASQVAAQN